MSSSAYWNSQYTYLMQNQPPAPESYYNKSFVDKMNEAQANIDRLVPERDKAYSAKEQKYTDYNSFYGNMSSYSEVYDKAENEFGVAQAKDNYEYNKKALAMAESTLSALPSSINAMSNRVLTQSQRERQYNILADRYTRNISNVQMRTDMYEQAWKNARESQAAYAQAEIAGQYSKLGDFNIAWAKATDEYNNAVKRVQQAEIEKADWGRQYRNWQQMQYQNANDIWLTQLQSALNRYTDALKTEQHAREMESQKRLADLQAQQNAKKTTTAKKTNGSAVSSKGKVYENGKEYSVNGIKKGNTTTYVASE